jgi:hypothetical protein
MESRRSADTTTILLTPDLSQKQWVTDPNRVLSAMSANKKVFLFRIAARARIPASEMKRA